MMRRKESFTLLLFVFFSLGGSFSGAGAESFQAGLRTFVPALEETTRQGGGVPPGKRGARGGGRDERESLKEDLKMIALEEVAGRRRWQRKKSPAVAVLSNMVLPGLGELYNGSGVRATIVVGLSTVYMGKAWIEHKRSIIKRNLRDQYPAGTHTWAFQDAWYEYHKAQALDYLWWSGAIWIIGMLDAYVGAHLFDIRAYHPGDRGGKGGYHYLGISFRF